MTEPNVPACFKRLEIPKLSAERRFAFQEIAPTALCVYANLSGAQQRYWGDNMGGWPVLMSLTQAWEDQRSRVLDKSEPYNPRALVARFWCDTWDQADALWQDTYSGLRDQFDDGRGEWMSFFEANLEGLTAAIRKHAEARRVDIWTDAEMVSRFDYLIAIAKRTEDLEDWTKAQNYGAGK